jgi:hypothetical protein
VSPHIHQKLVVKMLCMQAALVLGHMEQVAALVQVAQEYVIQVAQEYAHL